MKMEAEVAYTTAQPSLYNNNNKSPTKPAEIVATVPEAKKVEDATTEAAAPFPSTTALFSGAIVAVTNQASSGSGGERKKRGRPRKYGPDGMLLPLSPTSASASASAKHAAKGRLFASLGEWFAYSAGGNFTPHVVTVATGEDVASKIHSFSQKGPRAICVLSANGAISNATLRQPGSSGGTLTYEGRFEILSLSGSFTASEDRGAKSRTGGISVSLAGPDGRVIGGGVAGLLLAASPIQVVVGSFLPNTHKELKRKTPEATGAAVLTPRVLLTAAKPISQATPDDSCQTPTLNFPVQDNGDADNSVKNETINSSSYKATGWHGFQPGEHKPSPDINICLQGE